MGTGTDSHFKLQKCFASKYEIEFEYLSPLQSFGLWFSSPKLDLTPRLFHLYKGEPTKVTVGIIKWLCYLLLHSTVLKDF